MNQILEVNKKLKNKKVNTIKKYLLLFQVILSILIIIVTFLYIFYNKIKTSNKEKYSNEILNSYSIAKLYSDKSNNVDDSNSTNPYVIGTIEIKKLEIYYPIFSDCTDELLKISPCRFYGPLPGEKGNLCIAGHNYDNEKFFSKLSLLNINDIVNIYTYNNSFSYRIFDIYETIPTDTTPVYSYSSSDKLLTLITCNNLNKNRLIIKANLF